MPHVSLVAMSGFRVREPEMLALGMALPGLSARAQAVGALPSLGLLTLAALTPESWTQSYHEAAQVDDALIARLLTERPALVAISALTASIDEAYRLAGLLRDAGVRVCLGGLHATAEPAEALAHVDAVVVGEGELVWREMLEDAARGALRSIYRGTRPVDLAALPVPRFDLLGGTARPRFTLQTARGCPLACEFCGASRLLGRFREKPAALIARELEAIRAIRRRPMIELADDNTFAGRRDPRELLSVLEASGARWFTEADWRIGESPDVVDRLAASGCVQVLVGIESLAPSYRGLGAKAAPLARVMEAIDRVQSRGVAVIGCFIVGADGETEETLGALEAFALESPLADVQLTLQTPFPGTPLRARLEREGRLPADRGWSACTLFDVAFTPDRMSARALEQGFRTLVQRVHAAGPAARREEIRRQIWARRGEPTEAAQTGTPENRR